jgi:hypothetical protein
VPEAGQWLRALLEPTQQPLPEALAASVTKALTACAQVGREAARTDLDQALQIAQELGYL